MLINLKFNDLKKRVKDDLGILNDFKQYLITENPSNSTKVTKPKEDIKPIFRSSRKYAKLLHLPSDDEAKINLAEHRKLIESIATQYSFFFNFLDTVFSQALNKDQKKQCDRLEHPQLEAHLQAFRLDPNLADLIDSFVSIEVPSQVKAVTQVGLENLPELVFDFSNTIITAQEVLAGNSQDTNISSQPALESDSGLSIDPDDEFMSMAGAVIGGGGPEEIPNGDDSILKFPHTNGTVTVLDPERVVGLRTSLETSQSADPVHRRAVIIVLDAILSRLPDAVRSHH